MSWRAFLTGGSKEASLEPISLSWDSIGGPQRATLRLEDDTIGFESMRNWLGAGIEIYDPFDRLAWWGYVERVSQPLGMTGLESSLEGLANRVAVRYRCMEPGKDFGTIAQTEWKDDLTSQAIFGVKEALLEREVLSDEQAMQLRDISLLKMARPARHLQPSTKVSSSQVHCRGWFDRLRWRQWPVHTDLLGHSPNQQGFQSMGASLTQKSLAESFAFPDALKVTSVGVRIRKIGNPQDQVRFQLQTDALGQPSGTVRAEGVLVASAIPAESYSWVSVWFASPCGVTAGERLWLVAAREGAVSSTNYFSLGVDENLGFSGGRLLLQDASLNQWKARTPDADLLFKLTALSDSVDLMTEMVEKTGGFTGFSYEAGTGFSLPYVSHSGLDCHAAFLELLRLGTPTLGNLLVEVNSKRHLRVFPQPSVVLPRYRLGRDGRIKDEVGRDLEPAWNAVGNWLKSENGFPCFLENLRIDIPEGSFRLRTQSES